MTRTKLETLFTSNIPVDCHLLKGRLETEGIDCFVFDENIVWVFPFRAVAVGGVKLKVPSHQLEPAAALLEHLKKGCLPDEKGEYKISEILQTEYERQQEVLSIKSAIRNNPALLDKPAELATSLLSTDEVAEIVKAEKEFQVLANKKLHFSWDDFFYELFDFDRDVFKYLRVRPVEYYLDKELVDRFNSSAADEHAVICPNCKSDNTKYGFAIDYKWDVLYLVLSLLFSTPFPLIRKKSHCFDCGYDF
ncbi:DUF2007 domain-containing protein [uncultured Draconibacterium sp.]|uniref:DUF2007 domain-containing protein n=1 Tax=uncultured Draconibacterium sp. TaxID=1573823 RepID=UPI0029C70E08|nr:DUF2007 domain-containing protein [uncultured Draconibacterium sp.]